MIECDKSLQTSRQSEQCPCKGCTERFPSCHAHCQRYLDWKAEYDRIEANRKKYMYGRTAYSGSARKVVKSFEK